MHVWPENDLRNGQGTFDAPWGATLSWQDLSVYATNRGNGLCGQLINNARGAATPGNLTAILGGSGAGKSSLVMALAFRTAPGVIVHGDILVNGRLVGASYMRRHSSFMHQEDIFIGSMTVLEHLTFMARMKLDGRTRTREIRRRIDVLLREVGLTSRCDARIGNGVDDKVLSGGEKKRLAFATELLTDPKILFLDEPTTGLDACSAADLVSQLTNLVARGRTVLCTIHQPSSAVFDAFHRIILVADGRIAFVGRREQAVDFFASQGYECPRTYNPADFFVATVAVTPGDEDCSRRTVRSICDAFLTSDACKEIDVILQLELDVARGSYGSRRDVREEKDFEEPWWWSRLFWLTRRSFVQVTRNPAVQLARIVEKMVIIQRQLFAPVRSFECLALMAGLCFASAVTPDQLGIQAIQGVLFVLVTENTFSPMYAVLAALPREMPLFLREYRAGMYSVHLYYVVRMASLIPGSIVEPALFATIVYWLTGLRATTEAFGLTLLVLVLNTSVSMACGCFFSAAFDTVPLAMAYLVPFDYILMITMGPFVRLGTLPVYVRWVRYISWLLHSTEALTIVQWKGVSNITCETINPELPCIVEGSEVLERYDFDERNLWPDVLFMAIVCTIFHLLGYLCLWNRCRSRRA